MDGKLLTGAEVAQVLQVNKSFAHLLMQRGDLPVVRLGRLVRVRPEDLEKFIEEKASKPVELVS